ncbi:DUF6114 domain-containing protein [Humibacter sp. RRB41]|uniref:DUF6114 domain-containing protein n=1 Tax=Humibacter sp. RRB41 TaxID=2919946 RepID=UPI001FA978E6|nr:DUF6114 domain-containing protein [Humibacter sp. RRB41]
MEFVKRGWRAFVAWYRRRPFIGGVLTALGGIEMFFSGQLDIGHLHVQVGIEGFQATVIPIVLVVLGVLAMLMPQHRIFYGVIALVVAVYSLIGVNLGGFFIGMILASVGGVMIVSWAPRKPAADDAEPDGQAPHVAGVVGIDRADDEHANGDASGDEQADVRASSEQGASRGRTRRPAGRRRAAGGALAVALTIATATGMVALQPQRASAADPTGVCILGFIGDCSTPTPTPTSSGGSSSAPSSSPSSSDPATAPGTGTSTGTTQPSTPTGPALVAPADGSPVFTGKPALLQGSSLSFSGLRYLGLTTVHLSDGSTATVLKLSMDSVTIPGFRLDTRDAQGSGVDTVATQMAFSGGVDTYLASLKGVLANGSSVTYDIKHPPSTDGSMPVVRILSLEVFGITGGSSALTGFHEIIS